MAVIQKTKTITHIRSLEAVASPYEALSTGRLLVKAWADTIGEEQRLQYGRSFVHCLIKTYWEKFYPDNDNFNLPKFNSQTKFRKLDSTLISLAESLGDSASKLGLIEASFLIGAIYTVTIPKKERSEKGIYFTPPALTNRLLNLVEQEGVEWENATVLDPACGGGAFLAPVALRIVSSLKQSDPESILSHIESHVKGYEIDFFSAWLSQVFLEIALSKYCLLASRKIKSLIQVCDSLTHKSTEKYDVIIGNPPYGKIKLEKSVRANFQESLHGHANLYGLFTHIALQQIKQKGIIAFVTPTSFLAGEYFKSLRKMLLSQTTPRSFDFISFRKGVFEDVLQETILATYKAEKGVLPEVSINKIHPDQNNMLEVDQIGKFKFPENSSSVWILPRTAEQINLVRSMERMECRLRDWGYEINTGQLVWNRHKNQLSDVRSKNSYPLIWAESVTADGRFKWRAEKTNHKKYFNYTKGREWALIRYPCILLQRTTSKEQQRRLIAAFLPEEFILRYGAVVIENHLNIIKPLSNKPAVPIELLAAFLNSRAADIAFRCISGSVAVSAYELESMPLPEIKSILKIKKHVDSNKSQRTIEKEFLKLYKLK